MATRETILAVRLSPHERNQLEKIIAKRGLTSLAACVRYAVDRVYINEVVKSEWIS